MKIGFIGLGRMGQNMARRLLHSGHEVIGYNRTRARAEELAPEGLQVARSISEACDAEAVITVLSDDSAVESVVFGQNGILESLPEGRTHISMSTISPKLAKRLNEAHLQRRQILVSAPVLGRPDSAAQGKLFVLVGGPEGAIRRFQPVFDILGQKTLTLGDNPASANLMKIASNLMVASLIEILGEAFALIRKSGVLDPKRFMEVLVSTLFSGPAFRVYGGHALRSEFEPGLRIPLALKDIELVLDLAKSEAVPMPMASLLRDHFISAIAQGYQNLDWAALVLVAMEEAGIRNNKAA